MSDLRLSIRWLTPTAAYITVDHGNGSLIVDLWNEAELKAMANHLRDVADSVYPLEDEE